MTNIKVAEFKKTTRYLSSIEKRRKATVDFRPGTKNLKIDYLRDSLTCQLILPGTTITDTKNNEKNLKVSETVRRFLFQEVLAFRLARFSERYKLPRITSIKIKPIRILEDKAETLWPQRDWNEAIYLHLATESAALATIPYLGKGQRNSEMEIKTIKKHLDGAAAKAFDAIIQHRHFCSVGTSEAKNMQGEIQPGATLGNSRVCQRFCPQITTDVVDGTTLAALGKEEAISISALFAALPSWKGFPDIQALAAIVPRKAAPQIRSLLENIVKQGDPIEKHVGTIIAEIAQAQNKPTCEIKLMTHDVVDGSEHHLAMIDAIKKAGAIAIVPEQTTIEPPYNLGAFGIGKAYIDGSFGVFGGPEIVLSAAQLNCLSSREKGMDLLFMPASNTPLITDKGGQNLSKIFDFTGKEKTEMESLGIQPGKVYSFADIAGENSWSFASLVSVTGSNILGLKGVRKQGDQLFSHSLFLDPLGNVFSIEIERKIPHS